VSELTRHMYVKIYYILHPVILFLLFKNDIVSNNGVLHMGEDKCSESVRHRTQTSDSGIGCLLVNFAIQKSASH